MLNDPLGTQSTRIVDTSNLQYALGIDHHTSLLIARDTAKTTTTAAAKAATAESTAAKAATAKAAAELRIGYRGDQRPHQQR